MKIDVVIPNGNEGEFVKVAKLLGYDGLIFLYDYSVENKYTFQEKNFHVWKAIITEKILRKNKNLVFSKGSDNNRWIFEKLKPNVVFELELGKKKDRLNYRNSGLDQVLCKLAKKNNIKIGFSVHILDEKWILGRIMQNIRFCKKYDLDCFFASFARNPYEMKPCHDLKALSLVLGMDLDSSKKSFEVLGKMLQKV